MRLAHLLVLTSLLASSCSTIPRELRARPAKRHPSDKQTLRAAEAARRYASTHLARASGVEYPDTLSITWVDPPLTWKGKAVWGVTFDGCRIFVSTRDEYTPWQRTSLAHELIHCLHGQADGDWDPDHNDVEWWALLPGMQEAMLAVTSPAPRSQN